MSESRSFRAPPHPPDCPECGAHNSAPISRSGDRWRFRCDNGHLFDVEWVEWSDADPAPEEEPEACPTCGSPVRVAGDGLTKHYEPSDRPAPEEPDREEPRTIEPGDEICQGRIVGEIYVVPDPQERCGPETWLVIRQGRCDDHPDTEQLGIFWQREHAETFRDRLRSRPASGLSDEERKYARELFLDRPGGPRRCPDCSRPMVWDSPRQQSWMCPTCVYRRIREAERAARPSSGDGEAVANTLHRIVNGLRQAKDGVKRTADEGISERHKPPLLDALSGLETALDAVRDLSDRAAPPEGGVGDE